MKNAYMEQLQRELHELNGALDVIYALREKHKLRQADVLDDGICEVPDNIIVPVDTHDI